MTDTQLASIAEALRKRAAENGGALQLDRCLTGILLSALNKLAQGPERQVLAEAVARGDVISLADRRMVRDWTSGTGPEDAA